MDSPEQARFRLFDSITTFLKSASQKQPLVLVLDDLHWADTPSLLLLQFVARELGNSRLLLIGTYRDMELSRQHPLAETLGELTRERLFQRVLLRGLSQQDVGRFIEVAAGVDPPAGLAEAVHTQTEGNPLFVTEVVRLLVQEGELTRESGPRDSWTVRIPEGVREVIGRRLNRLSQRCNETLTIASVIGREFELRQLTPLVEDMSEDRLLEVLEEALSARVLEELPQAVGRYQFTHALIRETLIDELTLTRRVRLHARIAETLEEAYGDNAEAHAAELAHHFAEAEAVLGTEKLVRYSILAGERALTARSYEEALIHFRIGLQAKGISPASVQDVDNEQDAGLLFGLGQAQLASLGIQGISEAIAIMGRAFDYFVSNGMVAQAIEIAAYPLILLFGHRWGVTEMVSRALDLVRPGSIEEGRLLCSYGKALAYEEQDTRKAREVLDRGLLIARQKNNLALERTILVSSLDLDFIDQQWQELLEKSLRVVELASLADDPHVESRAGYRATMALCALGNPAMAESLSSRNLVLADRLHENRLQTTALFTHTVVSRLRGDWAAAREFSDRGLAVSPTDPRILIHRIGVEYELGEFGHGREFLDHLIHCMRMADTEPTLEYASVACVVPLVNRIDSIPDLFEVAEMAAEVVMSSNPPKHFDLIARSGKALMTVERRNVAESASQYDAIEFSRGLLFFVGMSFERMLGLLSQTMGKLDQAAQHFEDALAFCRKAGYRPELAWTCCDYADTLLQRASTSSAQAQPGDREKAMSLLDESLAISSELGMRPLMERVLSRRDILGA
ncbi:MAG: AAA family ATPase [Chloroflexi bacterium]|nr:AAA family ATPase [Chloroflexota bacterium]